MEAAVKIAGVLLVLLALLHAGFPRYFKWKEEFSGLSVLSRQMTHVHTFFIAFMVFLNGVLCICCSDELVHTRLGQKVCAGLTLFWFVRLICQLFIYSPVLWRGKMFETIIHIVFIIIWTYMSLVFLIVSLELF